MINTDVNKLCCERGCTRNINSQANYCLERQAQNILLNRRTFLNAPNGRAFDPAFPAFYRQGYMPPDNFSFNSIDIESALLNIGSCNLVTPKPPMIPRFRENLPVVNFFTPPKHIESPTFYPLLDQRPFICPMYS